MTVSAGDETQHAVSAKVVNRPMFGLGEVWCGSERVTTETFDPAVYDH
jgi:hypothetical protein